MTKRLEKIAPSEEQSRVTVVAIASHKGGVGKTTTTVQLGTGFSGASRDLGMVVLVDADAQGHVGQYLGVGSGPGFADALMQSRPVEECLERVPEFDNLRIMRGNLATWEVERLYAGDQAKQQEVPLAVRLSEMLEMLGELVEDQSKRTLVLIDTGPGFSEIQTAVLVVADYILCPLTPSVGGQIGMGAIWEWYRALKRNGKGFGILPQMFDMSSSQDALMLRTTQIQGDLAERMLPLIPFSRDLARGLDIGRTVWQLRKLATGPVGKSYGNALRQLASELDIELKY